MKKLQVLVATMNQKDMTLVEKMNLQCDAVIANQADRNEILTVHTIDNKTVKMITTATRGVGLNRNIALLAADAEIVLFADDDMTYYNHALENVVCAFDDNPEADMILFGIDYIKDGKLINKKYLKKKKLHLWNSMRYGTCAVAVRRNALLRHNITFHQCFGGGCIYGSGEDSLFIKDCFSYNLKVYGSEIVIGECKKNQSSWFSGFNEKYFYDKGAFLEYFSPNAKYLLAVYFAFHYRGKTDISFRHRLKLMHQGMRGGKQLKPYVED